MRKSFICFSILMLVVGFLYADEALNKKSIDTAQNENLKFSEKSITHGVDIKLKNSEAIEKYKFKDFSARDKRLNLMLISDSIKIETESLDKNVKTVKYDIKGDSVKFSEKNTKNPSQGYTYKFIAANSGISKIITEKIKFGKRKNIVEKKEYNIRVFNLKDVEKVSIADIVRNPEKFYEKFVIVSGYNRGWGAPKKTKKVWGTMITRSDWVLEDNSGAVYITGLRIPKEILKPNILAEVIRLSENKWAVRGDRILKREIHNGL